MCSKLLRKCRLLLNILQVTEIFTENLLELTVLFLFLFQLLQTECDCFRKLSWKFLCKFTFYNSPQLVTVSLKAQ